MNNSENPPTLPSKPSSRSHTLNVRLTAQEKADIAALAQQQGVTSSHMARHFLVQAIAYYKRRTAEQANDPDKWQAIHRRRYEDYLPCSCQNACSAG